MKTEIKKNINRKQILPGIVLISLIIPTIYLILQLIIDKQYNSDNILMLSQCVLGIFAFFLPNIIYKKFKLEIPPLIYFSYILFLYCSIVLGEVSSFYYKYDNWDDILHFCSGMMLGSLGFSIVALLNKNIKEMNLSPIFITMFAICFAVTIGVI